MKTIRTRSQAETERAGAKFAERLEPGDVVLISGELGAGKTTFVRGAGRALGVEGPMRSPTFTIGIRHSGGRVAVSHLDLYRLADLEDEEPELLADYLTPDAVAFVEWPAAGERVLQNVTARVLIEHAGGDERLLRIERNG